MPADFILALQISLVGMALVFAAIVLLWGLMALLVRLTPEPAPAAPDTAPSPAPASPAHARAALRPRAAAAAVAALLANLRPALAAPPPPTATVSPWQAAMRANRLRQRGPTR